MSPSVDKSISGDRSGNRCQHAEYHTEEVVKKNEFELKTPNVISHMPIGRE